MPTIRTAILLTLGTLFSGVPASAQRPNILFILADDVGQEVLECYGGQSYRTPHLNELSRTGMQFRNAFSMPVCHPTRLTLMTGKYPFRHGQISWGDFPVSEQRDTWANLVQESRIRHLHRWEVATLPVKRQPEPSTRSWFSKPRPVWLARGTQVLRADGLS